MNGKQYIGRRMSRYEGYGPTRAVDGIALVVDEEHEYRAGDMDGYVIEIGCPYGTQAMADALLRQLGGRSYTAYSAENAVMDPEAELGDGVTVNGAYTLLASRQMVFGSGHLGRIGAPADSEIDHEYGVRDTYDRRIERKLAQSRSYIDKTVDDMRIGVEGVQGDVAELKVSVGKVSSTVNGYDGRISKVEQTVGNIKLSVSGSLGGTAYISLSGGGGGSGSIDLSDVRQSWADDESNIDVYGGRTRFYGGSIEFHNNTFIADSDNLQVSASGTVTCRGMQATNVDLFGDKASGDVQDVAAILHGNMYLLQYDNQSSEGIYGAAGATNVELIYASTRYNGGAPSAVLGTNDHATHINGSTISLEHGPSYSSDRDIKKDIKALPEIYLRLLEEMRPVIYRYKDQPDDGPIHAGYIAQEMEAAITRAGLTRADVAALVGRDGTGQMGICYDELIPIMHMKINQLEQRLARLEAGT